METERADAGELALLTDVLGGGEPSGWGRVRAFEEEHGVRLPEPYRTVVAEVGDGCRQGPPAYGLLPLGQEPPTGGGGRGPRALGRDFPLTRAWIWEGEPDAPDDRALAAVFGHGSVVLGTDGCGMDWHLVVTGPQRGHVWLLTGEGAAPFGAEFGHTSGGPGFAGWVRHWAEDKEWWDAA